MGILWVNSIKFHIIFKKKKVDKTVWGQSSETTSQFRMITHVRGFAFATVHPFGHLLCEPTVTYASFNTHNCDTDNGCTATEHGWLRSE